MALSIVLAIVVGLGVYFVYQGLQTPQVSLLDTRLAQFGDHDMTLEEMEMTLPFVDRFLRPILDRFGQILSKRTPAAQQQALQDKINLAGRPFGLTVSSLLALRVVAFVVGIAVGYGLAALAGITGPMLLLLPVGGGIAGYIVPSIWIDRRVKARQKEILLALPNALDLLTISVEAGLGFDAAVARVCEKYRNALSLEFAQVLNEVRLGRPRLEALEEMGRRSRVDELTGFISAVVQSEQLGVGIANTLRIQSEEMRRRRRQRAEEQGQKAPLKMLFPMVGCIFPVLFIVLLGPAVLQVIKAMAS